MQRFCFNIVVRLKQFSTSLVIGVNKIKILAKEKEKIEERGRERKEMSVFVCSALTSCG